MPTNRKGERDSRIGLQAFLYALFLVPVSIIPYMLGVSGWVSAVVVVILSLGYAYFGWSFYRVGSRKSALQLMFFSFAYIPVSLVALFADKF